MGRADSPFDIEHIVGDGDYAIDVISGSRHQDRLEWLAQGRDEDPKDYACTAVLEHEPDNPFDSNAVSVSILGVRVGFLPRDAAARFVSAMDAWGFEQASCDAIIEGGWYRNAEDKGDFCVRLDANPDFIPAEVEVEDVAPVEAALVPVVRNRSKAGYDLKSMGLGAFATVAMLGLIGVVLLVVQPQTDRNAGVGAAVASLVPTSEPVRSEARLASIEAVPKADAVSPRGGANGASQAAMTSLPVAEARGTPEVAAVPSVRPVTALNPSTSVQDLRPPAPAAPPVTEARVPSSQRSATMSPPVVSGVAGNALAREVAAVDSGRIHPAETSASVAADPQPALAALPSPVATEVPTTLDRKHPAAVVVTSVVDEIDPPLTTASSPPPPPSPLPRPDQVGSIGDDSSPAPAAERAAKPERKAEEGHRRARLHRRSRATRSHLRSRARYSRRARRTTQDRSHSAADRSTGSEGLLSDTPAARMLRGWTEEWTSVSPLAHPRSVR